MRQQLSKVMLESPGEDYRNHNGFNSDDQNSARISQNRSELNTETSSFEGSFNSSAVSAASSDKESDNSRQSSSRRRQRAKKSSSNGLTESKDSRRGSNATEKFNQ